MTTQPDTAENLPPVMRAAWIGQDPKEAFEIFTDRIGAWWPLPTHGVFGEKSAGLAFRNEQLIEHSVEGNEAIWGEVQEWSPPDRLVFTWHPGRSASTGSNVTVTFEPDTNGTRIVLQHEGWEVFGSAAAETRRSYLGPNAWGYVLDHYADATESQPQTSPLDDLEAAYEAFYTEAAQGGFGEPEPGQWSAEQVVAHVALNDGVMMAVCQSLVHQNDARFENDAGQSPENLQRWIDSCGDMNSLIDRGRHASRQFMAAVNRLSAEQRITPVHCRLLSDGEVMLDDARPWESIAVMIQTGMHLPSHTEQLRSLRP